MWFSSLQEDLDTQVPLIMGAGHVNPMCGFGNPRLTVYPFSLKWQKIYSPICPEKPFIKSVQPHFSKSQLLRSSRLKQGHVPKCLLITSPTFIQSPLWHADHQSCNVLYCYLIALSQILSWCGTIGNERSYSTRFELGPLCCPTYWCVGLTELPKGVHS